MRVSRVPRKITEMCVVDGQKEPYHVGTDGFVL